MRDRGLAANQLLHLPGAGDFQMEAIYGAPPPPPTIAPASTTSKHHGEHLACPSHPHLLLPPCVPKGIADCSHDIPHDSMTARSGGQGLMSRGGMRGNAAGGGGAEGMDAAGGEAPLLEAADPARQESLQRENVPDPLAGEQTWPTDEARRSSPDTDDVL